MPTNNLKKTKKISQESIIYALISTVYFAVTILLFVYAIKFLGNTINTALSSPQGDEIEAKYSQLDLENYSLVANKIGLTPSKQVITESPAKTIEIVSSSTPEINITPTSSPEVIVASSTPPISQINTSAPIIEVRPKITIVNSTLRSGLAASLKSKLQSAGFEVIGTGNVRPSVLNTIIKVKNSVNVDSQYLAEIKKIVSGDYDFVIQTLEESADHEVEIIIGNK